MSNTFYIVICTYNRGDVLAESLLSVLESTKSIDDVGVLVVDNNSNDRTKEIVANYMDRFDKLEYLFEPKPGLSHARNAGARQVQSEWIIYIDDDVLISSEFMPHVHSTVANHSFDAFGGKDVPWYYKDKPDWMKDEYLSNNLPLGKTGILADDQFMIGCIMAWKKMCIESLGGFNTSLGMTGDQVAYGEETDLQVRARTNGFKIGYNPNWQLKHLVAPYKLDLSWFFISHFFLGRDLLQMENIDVNSNTVFFKILFVGIIQSILFTVKNLLKFIFNKNYYLENFLIDSYRKPTKRAGMLYHMLLQRKQHE